METKIKPSTKIDVKSTLLNIQAGRTVTIKCKLIKSTSVRSAVRVLNKQGYNFLATERGLIDEIRVTRNK